MFFILKDNSTDKFLTTEDILFTFLKDSFGSNDGSRFLIVVYSTGIGIEPDPLTDLRVIKISKKGFITVSPKIEYKKAAFPLDEGCEIFLQDLDGDGVNEVIATNTNWRTDSKINFIFKWFENKLLDVTPIIRDDSIHLRTSGLLDISISSFMIDGKRLIYSQVPNIVNKEFLTPLHRVYQLNNNNMEELGTYEYLTTVEKLSRNSTENVEVVTFDSAGEFMLTVKNISDQRAPVRAEVTINTNLVLKPSDFCLSPPAKVNKLEKDDDSDANEDHLKGCKTKSEVSVDLTLMKVNTIKVKLFCKKGSRVQVTLKRK